MLGLKKEEGEDFGSKGYALMPCATRTIEMTLLSSFLLRCWLSGYKLANLVIKK